MKIIVISILVFGQILSAQKLKKFYIEPTLTYKIHHPGAKTLNPEINTPYFGIKTTKVIYGLSVFPGINIGYSFKNNDKLSIGMNADASATGFHFYSLSNLTSSGSNGFSRVEYHFGSLYTNFTLIFKRNVFLSNSKIHQGRYVRGFLNLGVNYCYRPKYSSFTDEFGNSSMASDSTQIILNGYTSSSGSISYRVALKMHIGFDLTFGKNNIEWFSVNAGYSFSKNSAFSGNVAKISVISKTSTQKYTYIATGSGNGFYITLSRRIHPFVNRKKDRLVKEFLDNK